MIEVIQTANYLESGEQVKKIYELISEAGLSGVRVNLCKYRTDNLQQVIQEYILYVNGKKCVPCIMEEIFI